MWYLERLSARNICSFRELDYTLQQGVTTLIFGHNTDNENQKSNGSGKSTLIEAIAFGITGSPLRKVRSEEIINDSAEQCCVHLRFVNHVTAETLIVEREIYRKGTSSVRCISVLNGAEQVVAQATVDAYNNYILDRLGVTREELFSSFILSRHRYQDFLSSSDKDKKEIINRFSNGIVVDEAIARIEADLEPTREKQRGVDLEFASVEGRIEMLREQIRNEEDNRCEKEQSKQEKIAGIKATIAQKRLDIRTCKDAIAELKEAMGNMNAADMQLQTLEDSETPLGECMQGVKRLLGDISSTQPTDWSQIVIAKNREIAQMQPEIDKWTIIIANTGQKIACAQADFLALQGEHTYFEQDSHSKNIALDEEMKSLRERFAVANSQVEELKKRKRTIGAGIDSLTAKLAGKVVCPACRHEFLVSDEHFDVASARLDLEDQNVKFEEVNGRLLDNQIEAETVEHMMVHVHNETRDLEQLRQQWHDRIAKGERAVQSAEYEMEGARFNIKRIQDFVAARTKEIEDMRRSLFDEAYDILDAAKRSNERSITVHKEKICAADSSIDTLTKTIEELENTTGSELISSLKESLKSQSKKSSEVIKVKAALEAEVNALQAQQQIFVQFKSYLANTKIDALGSMMNRILADLGSDIRVNMSGYTVLKSGAIREKISVFLIRDGMDIGSFGKCSAGEAARVNLASLLAMQRLINGNTDFGKGLDLLVLDEILDAVDESGLANIFAALNNLNVTALVVSHGLITEGYPHRINIIKENGESTIQI